MNEKTCQKANPLTSLKGMKCAYAASHLERSRNFLFRAAAALPAEIENEHEIIKNLRKTNALLVTLKNQIEEKSHEDR